MKKALSFFVVAFFLMAGCSKVNDELAVNPNEPQLKSASPDHTISHKFATSWSIPLTCDNVWSDNEWLWGDVTTHCVMFGMPGPLQWMTMRFYGTLTLESTGETFKISEVDKTDFIERTVPFHANLIGDKGSHYIITGKVTYNPDWALTIDKAVCTGSAN